MSNMEIDRVLAQIRSISQGGGVGGIGGPARARPARRGAVDNGFAKLLKQGIDSVNRRRTRPPTSPTQVRARRARRRTAAGHARNAEGQRVVSRADRGAQQVRRCVPRNHEHAAVSGVKDLFDGCRTVNRIRLRTRHQRLKPLLLLVGVAAAVAAGVGVMLWSVGPTYSLLYSNLAAKTPRRSPRRSTGAAHSLQARRRRRRRSACRPNNSPRRVCKLAAQGLPEGGGGVNAMTKDPGFGVSAFMENARYQHALETELARTIAILQNVQGARVHLAMARQSAFVSDRRPGSCVGVPADQGRAPSRRRAGAGHRQPRGLEHSGAARPRR